MYERILVPLDGSELAQIALPYAEKLAWALGSQIILIYVSESDEDKYQHMHQFYLRQMIETAKRDGEAYQDRQGLGTIRVDSAILVGDPAEEIVEYAGKQDSGLIVMSTHGRSGIKRWAMGSIADKVLRATKQPISLIRAKGARPDTLGERTLLSKILVALDGSKESEAVIPYIEELAFGEILHSHVHHNTGSDHAGSHAAVKRLYFFSIFIKRKIAYLHKLLLFPNINFFILENRHL